MKKTHCLAILALATSAVSHAATITLSNADFESGVNSGTFPATDWPQTNGAGTNSPTSSTYWQPGGAVAGIATGAIYMKSDGGNYIQQVFNASDLGAVDATTFESYAVTLDYGCRVNASATNHTIRLSLWNVTDNLELAGTDFVVAPITSGNSSLSSLGQVFNLTYDNTAAGLAGDQIAIRFTSVSPDLGSNAWHRTAIIDNVAITAVPEPASALLGALGLFGLLRRRR